MEGLEANSVPSRPQRWLSFRRLRHTSSDSNFAHQSLPTYGKVYLNHLVGEFESLKGEARNDCVCQQGQQIVDRAKSGENITWGDIYVLERIVLVMLPDIEVHQRLWCLEMRYRDAVGDSTAYENFLRVDASDLGRESIPHARARLDNLIRELYRLYTVTACREHLRKELSRRATVFAVVLLGLIIGLIFITINRHPELSTFAIVYAAGALGGTVSFERKLQSLPSRGESLGDLVELDSRSGVYFSPIIGGVFAIVLYVLFASGLITGSAFPKLVESSGTPVSFLVFFADMRPVGIQEWGKLLIWCFIAGFAERFVPDTLDRLIARSDEKKKQSA